MKKKTALVLEGGGFRGMFTAGILEIFLENQVFFDAVYGVSAGASYGASYLSKQSGRNLRVNDFIGDRRYCGVQSLIRTGSFFSWEFIYEELAHKIVPFDYDALRYSNDFFVGVSNCSSGKAEFIKINELNRQDFQAVLIASSSLPLMAPIVHYMGEKYLDGGLADSIPFEYAISQGADRVVVILTRPRGYMKPALKFKQVFKWRYRKYPKVYEMLESRARRYNESLRKLEELEKKGKAFVIYPEQKPDISRLENKPHKTAKVYHEAMSFANAILPALQDWLKTGQGL